MADGTTPTVRGIVEAFRTETILRMRGTDLDADFERLITALDAHVAARVAEAHGALQHRAGELFATLRCCPGCDYPPDAAGRYGPHSEFCLIEGEQRLTTKIADLESRLATVTDERDGLRLTAHRLATPDCTKHPGIVVRWRTHDTEPCPLCTVEAERDRARADLATEREERAADHTAWGQRFLALQTEYDEFKRLAREDMEQHAELRGIHDGCTTRIIQASENNESALAIERQAHMDQYFEARERIAKVEAERDHARADLAASESARNQFAAYHETCADEWDAKYRRDLAAAIAAASHDMRMVYAALILDADSYLSLIYHRHLRRETVDDDLDRELSKLCTRLRSASEANRQAQEEWARQRGEPRG